MTPTDLDILLAILFTWSLKVRFSSSVTPRNLTVETFVRIVSRILMSNSFFLVGDYHIWSFTNVEWKSVGLEPVINSHQFPVHWGMNIVNVAVGCKNCCIVSKMNKEHLVWGSMHVIDVQKKKYRAQHRALRNTLCNVWHWGAGVFDWDILFPIA